ncbi:MAG: hypothetical protein K6C34_05265 [Alphaproteobacteria bacterium]|nr:hypothetical protein [Alphaproteobacteria bacterium]
MLKRCLVSLAFVFFNLTAMHKEMPTLQRDIEVTPVIYPVTIPILQTALESEALLIELKIKLMTLSAYERELQQQLSEIMPSANIPLQMESILTHVGKLEYKLLRRKISVEDYRAYETYLQLMSQGNEACEVYWLLMRALIAKSSREAVMSRGSWMNNWIDKYLSKWMEHRIADQTLLNSILNTQK